MTHGKPTTIAAIQNSTAARMMIKQTLIVHVTALNTAVSKTETKKKTIHGALVTVLISAAQCMETTGTPILKIATVTPHMNAAILLLITKMFIHTMLSARVIQLNIAVTEMETHGVLTNYASVIQLKNVVHPMSFTKIMKTALVIPKRNAAHNLVTTLTIIVNFAHVFQILNAAQKMTMEPIQEIVNVNLKSSVVQ